MGEIRQIANWLKSLGLEQYTDGFTENDIDFSILHELTDQDLEKIGVRSLGHRRKLLRAIGDLERIEKRVPAEAHVAARFASPERYTPKHLAGRILTSKGALEGERKQVTVLFADLKGSMELLADRDPEEARKLLDPVLVQRASCHSCGCKSRQQRCYGASGDDIASIGRLLTERWLHRRDSNLADGAHQCASRRSRRSRSTT
jgi:hypothetical protein